MHANVTGSGFITFVLHQHAFSGSSAVDVGGEAVGSFDDFKAAYRNVFAQFGNHGFALAFYQFGQGFNSGRFFLSNSFGYELGKGDEAGVFGHEVGFAVHFHQSANFAFNSISQHAFGSGTAGQLAGFGAGFNAQDFFSFGHVAVGFHQGFFAFHHAQASGGTQISNHFCGNCRHYLLLFY